MSRRLALAAASVAARAHSGLERRLVDRHGALLVPRHDHRRKRQGHHRQATGPHRLALADGDRVAVRDRRGRTGDRGRRPVRLSEDRPEDALSGLHPERRGDRGLPARPRRDLVRPEGPRRLRYEARHPGRLPQCGRDAPGAYQQIRQLGKGDRPRCAEATALVARMKARSPGSSRSASGATGATRLPRARPELLLGDVEHVRRPRLRPVRPPEHRGCRTGRLRLPAALARVHRLVEPRPGRARRLGVLRADGGDGRGAPRLVGIARRCATGSILRIDDSIASRWGRGS